MIVDSAREGRDLIVERGAAGRGLETARGVLLAALAVGMAVSISLTQVTLGALVAWVLFARWRGQLAALRWPLGLPIAAFVGWTLIAALASAHPLESLVEARGLLNILAIVAIANALPDRPAARRFATWLLVALTGAALFALVQVAACPGPDFAPAGSTLTEKLLRKCGRARGFYSIYMTLAGVLAMALAGALPRLARLGPESRWLAPAWIVTATALALTYVRGAWIGLVAGVLTAIAGLGRRGVIAAVLLVGLGVGLLAVLPDVRHRAATIGSATDDTTRDRMAMLEVGLRLAGENPLTGIGPGRLRHVYPDEAPSTALRRATSHVHNTPLQIAVQSGVVGLAAWLWVFVAFFRRAGLVLRSLPAEAAGDRALVLGSLAAIVTFVMAGLFEYNFGDSEVLLVAAAVMALPFALAGDRVASGPGRPA